MNVNAYVGRTGLLVIKIETTLFEVTSLDKTSKLELNVHLLRNTKTNKIELNVISFKKYKRFILDGYLSKMTLKIQQRDKCKQVVPQRFPFRYNYITVCSNLMKCFSGSQFLEHERQCHSCGTKCKKLHFKL